MKEKDLVSSTGLRLLVQTAFVAAISIGGAWAQPAEEVPVPMLSPGMEGEVPSNPELPDDPALLPEPEPLALFVDPQCEVKLKEAGAVFVPGDPVEGERGCGIERPLDVSEIVPGITLRPRTQMRCETALALANWIKGSVLSSVEAMNSVPSEPGEEDKALRLTGLTNAASYDCRRRNNRPTGKLSEHSVGSAIDVSAFSFENGSLISVGGGYANGSVERAFIGAVRGAACLYFTTVLGPGSDGHHEDHLHLDMAVRRGGYRYCR